MKNPAVIPVAAVKQSRSAASNIKLANLNMKEKLLTFVAEREAAFKMSPLHIQWMHTELVDCQSHRKLPQFLNGTVLGQTPTSQ